MNTRKLADYIMLELRDHLDVIVLESGNGLIDFILCFNDFYTAFDCY